MRQYLFRLHSIVDEEKVECESGVVQAGDVQEAARAVEAYTVKTLGWPSGSYDAWLYWLKPRGDVGVLETNAGFEPCTITVP